jgi:hypothetical protein
MSIKNARYTNQSSSKWGGGAVLHLAADQRLFFVAASVEDALLVVFVVRV